MKNNSKIVTRSFVGKHADDLGQLISVQIKPVYEMLGIIVPVKSCSIIHALDQLEKASLADLAKGLDQSHQLVKQKLPRLLKLNLIFKQQDLEDKRRTIYGLTEEGVEQAKLLSQYSLEQVYQQLSKDINADLGRVLTSALEQLKEQDLLSRYLAHTKLSKTNKK
ncbi:MAG: hypothetical protein ACSHWU_09550 [Marinicella sp.]